MMVKEIPDFVTPEPKYVSYIFFCYKLRSISCFFKQHFNNSLLKFNIRKSLFDRLLNAYLEEKNKPKEKGVPIIFFLSFSIYLNPFI